MSNDYLSISGTTLVWPIHDTEVSVYRVNTNGSYTLIGTSSSSSFSIVQYSGIVMQYAVSVDSESGYSNIVEIYLPITSDVSGINGSEYIAAALESTMTGEDIKTILHTHRDAFTSPVFTVPVSDMTKLVDTSTEAYDPILPFTVVLCKDGSAIDILASYIQNGELIYFAGTPGAILTYNILDDVSDPSDSTIRVSYYPDSDMVVQNIPGSTTVVVRIDDDLQGVTIAGVNYRLNSSGVMIPFGPNGLRVSLVGIGSWVSRTANSCTFSVSGTVAYLTGLNSSTGTLTVPASFTLSGVTYNVLGITGTLTNASFVSNLIFDASSTFTTIPASAFTGCTNLSSITLPPGITTIGDYAFNALTNLRTITNLSAIPLTTVGAYAFQSCHKLVASFSSSITDISNIAFHNCSGTGLLTFAPMSLRSLGSQAFYLCANLSGTFDLSNSSITTIPNSCFGGSTKLQSVKISSAITSIADTNWNGVNNAGFAGCTSLSNISFYPNSKLSFIGSYAFINCGKLTGTLPSTITDISSSAFRSCSLSGGLVCPTLSLQSLGASAFLNCGISGSFDVSGLTAIPSGAFESATNIQNLYNTQNLTTIGATAFANCHRLVASFSSSITSIGTNAFICCGAPGYVPSATMTGLLTFAPMSLSSLGTASAFESCANLSGSIDFSNSSITILPNKSFANCRNLTSVKFSSAITTIANDSVFGGCTSLSNISFYPNSQLQSIGSNAFLNCSNLTGTLPSTITVIGVQGFRDCGKVGGFECPTLKLTSLGMQAFLRCGISGSFDVSGLTAIPTSAFDAATNIRNIYNTQNLTTIANGAFSNCHRLVASFSSSITSIGASAFITCGAPSYVPSASMTGLLTFAPMTLSSLGTNAFDTCVNLSGSIDFSNSSITAFTASAFTNCINLTSVTMPPLLNSIGSAVFYECVNLTTIPNIGAIPLTFIGFRAFRACHKLIASFPSSITDIDTQAFRNCGAIGSYPYGNMTGLLTFAPMSLRSMGNNVFHQCINLSGSIDLSNSSITTFTERSFALAKNLQSIKLSSAISRIPDAAINDITTSIFGLCTSLSNISFYPNSQLSYIGFLAFNNCPNLTGTLPSTITDISASAFDNCSLSGGLICPTLKLNTLGASAFYNCGISGSFDISGLRVIPMNALYGAYNIQTIYNAQNLTRISDAAFYGCTNLTTITNIEASPLTYIGYQAFQGCILLPSLSLPASVLDISNDAFLNCSGGMPIVFAGPPPVLTASGSLNTTTTMYGVYPSALEDQWLPWISGGLFRNLQMRSSQMRIAMTTTAQPIYNLSSVSFSLSGTPNTVYSIYDASAVCVSGNMTSTTMSVIVSDISDGPHSFYATLTDVVGNVISSTPILLMIDTITPAAPILSGAPKGAIQQRTATIGISGELGTTYHIYTNGSLNASGTLTDGTTYTLSDLADASYSVYATLTDSAGNMRSSSSSTWSVYTPVVYEQTVPATTFVQQILTTITDPVVQKQILIDNAASIATPIIPLTTVNIASLLTISTATFEPQAVSLVLPNVDISSSDLPDASASLYLLGNTGSTVVYKVDGVSSTVVFDSSSVTIQDVTTPIGQAFVLFGRVYILAGCGSAFITPLTLSVSGSTLIWNGPDSAFYSLVRVNTDNSTTVIDTPSNTYYDISRYVGLTIAYRVDMYSNTTSNTSSNILTVTFSPTDYPPAPGSIPPTEYITAGLQSATPPATLKVLLDNNGAWFSSNLTTLSGLDCSVLIDPSRCSANYPVEYFTHKPFTFAMMYADASFQSAEFPMDTSSVLYIAIPSNTDVSIQIDGTIYTLNVEYPSFTLLTGESAQMYGLTSVFALQSATYTIGAFGCMACIPYTVYTPTNVAMNGTVISWLGSESDTDISYGVYNVSGDALVGITSNLFLDVSATVYPLATYYVVGITNSGVNSASSTAVSYVPPPINLPASGLVLMWNYPANADGLTFTLYSVSEGMYTYETSLTDKQFDTDTLKKANGTYTYVVTACYNFTESTYSNTMSVTINNGEGGGVGLDPRVVVPCFLADAPVLTPTGYTKISKLSVGDEVLTADGRAVAIKKVSHTRVEASPSVHPYVIPKGLYGATSRLLISPDHRVVTDHGLIEAKHLKLTQEVMTGSFDYYNLELPNWKSDNMVVGGVQVESLAPIRRITMTLAQFKANLIAKYGTITPEILAKVERTCRILVNGTVECPVLAK